MRQVGQLWIFSSNFPAMLEVNYLMCIFRVVGSDFVGAEFSDIERVILNNFNRQKRAV